MRLEPVWKEHHKFLYRLLSQREPYQNISHKSMPTWSEHVDFVNSRPYSEWYIIIMDDLYVGAIYLSRENEIGLFIDKKYRGAGLGSIALNMLIKSTHVRPLKANIAPSNVRSRKFFERHGFTLMTSLKSTNVDTGEVLHIQDTYWYYTTPDEFYGSD